MMPIYYGSDLNFMASVLLENTIAVLYFFHLKLSSCFAAIPAVD